MDTEKIIQELERRFAAPLPEFYKRRIIVWHDEDREFEDGLSEIVLTNAKVVALTGTNFFSAKKLLGVDDTSSNYLVYSPIAYESLEDNWLLDIELYSEEFRADLISMWMDEMGVPQTPGLRKTFKAYRRFLGAKERRRSITMQTSIPATPAGLQLSIMAALAGLREAKPDHIIKAILKGGLTAEDNRLYRDFVNYKIDGAFWQMAAQGTGCQVDLGAAERQGEPIRAGRCPGAEGGLGCHEADADLGRLAMHILLTAAARTMGQESLTGLDGFISTAHQAYCYDLISDWLHSDDAQALHEIVGFAETEARLPQRFMELAVDDLADTEVFPCIDEIILIKLMQEIGDHIIDVEAINRTVEKRRTCAWYDEVKNFYDGILQISNMQAFYKAHSGGFHTVEPKKVWERYTSAYYMMDTYYRQFHKSYAASLKTYHTKLSDLFATVMEKAEGLYSNWFLGQLGNNWSDACADDLRRYGRIPEIPQQTDFYRSKIADLDSRIYVIVSDGMRYEVAVELAGQLRRETQSQVRVSSMQGIFPTITKFGMAALLPHEKLSAKRRAGNLKRLAVLADGQSTEADNRDRLLKNAKAKSVALQYKDMVGMKRASRQALVKGMDVVYIYHDTIDEAGHLNKSVFGACDEAIAELKNIVRIITNEFGGANILITSDHGFLYTYRPLNEDEKVDKTTESEQDIEVGRRYAIMQKGARPPYLLPVKFLDGQSGLDAFAPRESIRIKVKGGGLNFVHGGISLQEMVVPVIDYHFLRNDSKEYKRNRSKYDTKPVTVSLLSASRKISNMIFSLSFYQKEAVAANREAAIYQLYFTDSSGRAISDTARIIADKTSDNARERTFRCRFNLKSLDYSNTETYYLITADEDGLPVSREEFQIDLAFTIDGSDFFG